MPLSNFIYKKSVSTLVATLVIVAIYFILNYFLCRRNKNKKQVMRVKARITHFLLFLYIIFFARIWVDGFSHIFTVLGLVSAALVVTNKESIMNLVSWFIISWRGLFAEGDYIEINKVSGYVSNIGAFYFTLSNKKSKKHKHAQLIKVPNGQVLNNTMINHSQTDALYEKSLRLVFSLKSDYKNGRTVFEETIKSAVTEFIQNTLSEYSKHEEEDYEKTILATLSCATKLSFEKPCGVECVWRFDCLFAHHQALENLIWERWLEALGDLDKVELTFTK